MAICDKCIKKRVCRLCDGSNIQGCIEFYLPHEEVLQKIKDEINGQIEFEKECDDSDIILGLNLALEIIKQTINEIKNR